MAEGRQPLDREEALRFYQPLLSIWLHQDGLLWSRTQLLLGIQLAVLAGAYLQRDMWLGPMIMLLGGAVTTIIILLVARDEQVYIRVAKEIESILPADLKQLAPLKLTGQPRWIGGRLILRGTLFGVLLLDLFLFVLYLVALGSGPCPFPLSSALCR